MYLMQHNETFREVCANDGLKVNNQTEVKELVNLHVKLPINLTLGVTFGRLTPTQHAHCNNMYVYQFTSSSVLILQ